MSNDTDELKERYQVLRDTYLSRAQADAEIEAQGRFKKQNPTTVTSVPQYPRQPTNSHPILSLLKTPLATRLIGSVVRAWLRFLLPKL
jgi:hypothetical protein